jgi:hypothetical protein
MLHLILERKIQWSIALMGCLISRFDFVSSLEIFLITRTSHLKPLQSSWIPFVSDGRNLREIQSQDYLAVTLMVKT